MRFFRLMAIVVLLLACVVLGSACTGAQGEQGPKGDIGATGATGPTGPIGPAGPAGATGATGTQGIQGLKGDKGDTGAQGIQGPAGPSMIAAMGAISDNGTIDYGYNVDDCTWDNTSSCYVITLTGIFYTYNNFVTIVTPTWTAHGGAGYAADYCTGTLLVYIYDDTGTPIQSWFSFMVLAKP